MSNSVKIEFLNACRVAVAGEDFRRLTLSGGKGEQKFRARFELVLGETKRLLRASDNSGGDTTTPLDVEKMMAQLSEPPFAAFRAATLSIATHDLLYTENRKGEPKLTRGKASIKGAAPAHNRTKNYVLREDRPYLQELGVTSPQGRVIKKHHPKFRQIANFVEIMDRDIGDFVSGSNKPVSLLDLGCGKGYLTFAAYDYVRSRARHEPVARGIDIKTDMIDLCNSISDRLGFEGLTFVNARIQPGESQDVDILIALHACDTATDDALALGLRSNMKFLFCAPCCQAEIAAQLVAKSCAMGASLSTITTYPLMRRRQADIITDTARALLLTALGYEVKFLEFTALEHTSKNIMLVGKQSDTVDRAAAWRDYLALKKDAGFERHALEENVRDLLRQALG